jgi:hypothetical protein
MKIGPLSGPILSGTKVHGPRTTVRGVVLNYRTNRNWKHVLVAAEVTEISA